MLDAQDRVTKGYQASGIDRMLESGCEYFSLIRVDPLVSVDFAGRFFTKIDEIYDWPNQKMISWSMPLDGTSKRGTHPRTYVLGNEHPIQDMTNEFLSLVRESRTGKLYQMIREDFEKNSEKERWLDKLQRCMDRGIGIKVGYGPKYFSKEQMIDFSELFFPGKCPKTPCCSSYDDL